MWVSQKTEQQRRRKFARNKKKTKCNPKGTSVYNNPRKRENNNKVRKFNKKKKHRTEPDFDKARKIFKVESWPRAVNKKLHHLFSDQFSFSFLLNAFSCVVDVVVVAITNISLDTHEHGFFNNFMLTLLLLLLACLNSFETKIRSMIKFRYNFFICSWLQRKGN